MPITDDDTKVLQKSGSARRRRKIPASTMSASLNDSAQYIDPSSRYKLDNMSVVMDLLMELDHRFPPPEASAIAPKEVEVFKGPSWLRPTSTSRVRAEIGKKARNASFKSSSSATEARLSKLNQRSFAPSHGTRTTNLSSEQFGDASAFSRSTGEIPQLTDGLGRIRRKQRVSSHRINPNAIIRDLEHEIEKRVKPAHSIELNSTIPTYKSPDVCVSVPSPPLSPTMAASGVSTVTSSSAINGPSAAYVPPKLSFPAGVPKIQMPTISPPPGPLTPTSGGQNSVQGSSRVPTLLLTPTGADRKLSTTSLGVAPLRSARGVGSSPRLLTLMSEMGLAPNILSSNMVTPRSPLKPKALPSKVSETQTDRKGQFSPFTESSTMTNPCEMDIYGRLVPFEDEGYDKPLSYFELRQQQRGGRQRRRILWPKIEEDDDLAGCGDGKQGSILQIGQKPKRKSISKQSESIAAVLLGTGPKVLPLSTAELLSSEEKTSRTSILVAENSARKSFESSFVDIMSKIFKNLMMKTIGTSRLGKTSELLAADDTITEKLKHRRSSASAASLIVSSNWQTTTWAISPSGPQFTESNETDQVPIFDPPKHPQDNVTSPRNKKWEDDDNDLGNSNLCRTMEAEFDDFYGDKNLRPSHSALVPSWHLHPRHRDHVLFTPPPPPIPPPLPLPPPPPPPPPALESNGDVVKSDELTISLDISSESLTNDIPIDETSHTGVTMVVPHSPPTFVSSFRSRAEFRAHLTNHLAYLDRRANGGLQGKDHPTNPYFSIGAASSSSSYLISAIPPEFQVAKKVSPGKVHYQSIHYSTAWIRTIEYATLRLTTSKPMLWVASTLEEANH